VSANLGVVIEQQRMSGDERRAAIVKAVLPLFARQGFSNTTTRELAEAAGVSEALLYKHFPSKDSLYAEIQNFGKQGGDPALEKLATLEPSTSTLVHIIYYIMRTAAMGRPNDPIGWETRHRLILNSCLEDGDFPRYLFNTQFSCCLNKIDACLGAAQKAGDLVSSPVATQNRCLFSHHLASMIAIMHLPKNPVVNYRVSRQDLLNQAVWFVLRGMGLNDHAIATYYNAEALSLFFGLGIAS
jgi:AcrR family transcriptional regulator